MTGEVYETIDEAAARLCVHRDTIRRRIAAGDIPAYRSGSRLIRLKPGEVDAALLRRIPSTKKPDEPTTRTLGEQLNELMQRMDAAYAAWRAAGHPSDGPTVDAKEQVYTDLRAFNARAAQ